ncbi:MAG: M48 family metallopeptidase [Halolamina sp.]
MFELHVALVGLLVGTQALFTALAVLNVRHSERELRDNAEWLRESLGLSEPERNADYLRLGTGIGQLESWVFLGAALLVLYSGLYRDAVAFVAGLGLGPLLEGVVLLVGLVVLTQLASVPFGLVRTFVVEELFEFNQQTLGLWARDQLIGLVVSIALVAVLGGGILLAIDALGALWPVAGVALIAAVSLLMLVLVPQVIMPLQYDFTPIEDGELRDAVESVFERAGFTCEGIFEVELSSHTTKSNAFFMGFGPAKRVGLGDTLIERHDLDEIESVLAHELGHYRLRHIWKRLGAMLVRYGVSLTVLAVLLEQPWLTAMFGLPATDYAALLTASIWLWPVSRLAAPLDNRLSIRHEYQADAFAAETTGDPRAEMRALAKLEEDNLGNPFPHPWYELVHYDHPPIPKRVRAVGERFLDGADVEEVVGGRDDDHATADAGTQPS